MGYPTPTRSSSSGSEYIHRTIKGDPFCNRMQIFKSSPTLWTLRANEPTRPSFF